MMRLVPSIVVVLLIVFAAVVPAARPHAPAGFDHTYADYAVLLAQVVREPRVDYGALKEREAQLRAIETLFGSVTRAEVGAWPRSEQIAFWANAYNLFTLRAIVDHYPIQSRLFSLGPRNSIRQISGVWDRLTWPVVGERLTLDHIEHEILRPVFKEPLIHFAVNCASVSCPILAREPYRGDRLSVQLAAAARRYLASPLGLSLSGTTVSVSSIFKWYGDDFVEVFREKGPARGSETDRAILGVVATFGPSEAAALARSGQARLRFLDYDWSLNDVLPSRDRSR